MPVAVVFILGAETPMFQQAWAVCVVWDSGLRGVDREEPPICLPHSMTRYFSYSVGWATPQPSRMGTWGEVLALTVIGWCCQGKSGLGGSLQGVIEQSRLYTWV